MPHHDTNGPGSIVGRLTRVARLRWAQRTQDPRPVEAAASARPDGSDGPPRTTLDATIRPEQRAGYRRLVWADGEPHLTRTDLGVAAEPDRVGRRRPILYFAHHTDTHVCDAQSPSRLEPGERFAWFNPGADGGHRPQEACTAQVLDQIVQATNAVTTSPVTGAEMAVCVQTGDNTDNRTTAETDWFLGVLAGREVTPNTGAPGRYEGIQRSGVTWTFQADDPSGGAYGRAGFPTLPGFLDAAVQPFQPTGLAVPWVAVMGNHDAVFLGTFGPLTGLRFDRYAELLIGAARKPIGVVSMLSALARATFLGVDPGRWDRGRALGRTLSVTADPVRRAPLDVPAYVSAFLADGDQPGPAGHGFTEENRDSGTAWWSRPQGDDVQLIGLDTCNHTTGSEGVLSEVQFRWLEAELERHHSRWRDADGRWQEGAGSDRLCLIFSHHNSWTMTNTMKDVNAPGARHQGADLVRLLQRFPNVVLWVNGHSHEHRIVAHPAEADGVDAGFWEINTASCIDFGQQARTIEIVDNGDETLSVFTTVLDHAGPPSVDIPDDGSWTTASIASVSRELALNDSAWFDPVELLGSPTDRNTELLIRAPFKRA